MSIVAFDPPGTRSHFTFSHHFADSQYQMAAEAMADRRMSSANESNMSSTTLILRKLPRNTTSEAVRTMLLFAKDFKDTEMIPNEYEEDSGFATAVARFSSMVGASEAQAMLDGKPNTAGHANMIVDIISGPALSGLGRRNTIDPIPARKLGHSVSPPLTNSQRPSRFNGTFQSMDKISPPLVGSPPDHSSSEGGSNIQTIFSPQSPVANMIKDRSRVSGKSMIGEDGADDETGELLKDPLAYLNNNTSTGRKSVNTRLPTNAFSQLSLNTGMQSPTPANYTSPRSAMNSHVPFSPSMNSNTGYQPPGHHYMRHNYPPVNPADQNPPCNTLYVGNLPIDTSEDELKAMFSKQRGYKRLCFRTKQNGPMCFVEFEDISFATKALNELYGVQLHNSIKGGIRLSFSKNPLGVRAGQPGNNNLSTPLSATGSMNLGGMGSMSPGIYNANNGPPPGLTMPPGLSMSPMNGPQSPPQMPGAFVHQGLGIGSPAMSNIRGMSVSGASGGPTMNGSYPDYMMGR